MRYCKDLLDAKLTNVAVVFNGDKPTTWMGYPVIDGDLTDERFKDNGYGNIIALRYKKPKGKKINKNKFVINV